MTKEIIRLKSRRILAPPQALESTASELEWIESRTRILGESFGRAVREVHALIASGALIVVREEEIAGDRVRT